MPVLCAGLLLAGRPKLLLADEPTSALDVLSKMKLLDLLSKLHQEEKMAILFVTHDISVAEHLAQKVVVTRPKACPFSKLMSISNTPILRSPI